jgi:hypothetical protein
MKHTPDSSPKIKNALRSLIVVATLASALVARADTITNNAPLAANDTLQRSQNSGARVRVAALLANDSDPDHGSLTLSAVGPTSAAGGVIYNPPAGFTNADSFSYVIANSGGLQATGSVSVTIRADASPSQNVLALEQLGNGSSRIQFLGIPGRLYTIEYTEGLETPDWRPLGKRTADATGRFEFVDPPGHGIAPRFYRSTYP